MDTAQRYSRVSLIMFGMFGNGIQRAMSIQCNTHRYCIVPYGNCAHVSINCDKSGLISKWDEGTTGRRDDGTMGRWDNGMTGRGMTGQRNL